MRGGCVQSAGDEPITAHHVRGAPAGGPDAERGSRPSPDLHTGQLSGSGRERSVTPMPWAGPPGRDPALRCSRGAALRRPRSPVPPQPRPPLDDHGSGSRLRAGPRRSSWPARPPDRWKTPVLGGGPSGRGRASTPSHRVHGPSGGARGPLDRLVSGRARPLWGGRTAAAHGFVPGPLTSESTLRRACARACQCGVAPTRSGSVRERAGPVVSRLSQRGPGGALLPSRHFRVAFAGSHVRVQQLVQLRVSSGPRPRCNQFP